MTALVGIDSQALTYLVEAAEPGYDPTSENPALAAERMAMIRSVLYGDARFWVMPTVEVEYNRIQDPDRHLRHQRAARILLHDASIGAAVAAIDARTTELQLSHSHSADCRIVAETELAGLAELVTFDGSLIANLTGHARVRLVRPSAFWQALGIPRGAALAVSPHPSNPLAQQSWWRW